MGQSCGTARPNPEIKGGGLLRKFLLGPLLGYGLFIALLVGGSFGLSYLFHQSAPPPRILTQAEQALEDHVQACNDAADKEELEEDVQEAQQKLSDYRHGIRAIDRQPFDWAFPVHLQECLVRPPSSDNSAATVGRQQP